jgi:hypothetical protein
LYFSNTNINTNSLIQQVRGITILFNMIYLSFVILMTTDED